jgi:hypothetical protein
VETSKSDLFAEGLKRSIEQPIDAVKNIAQDPVGSIKKVPAPVDHVTWTEAVAGFASRDDLGTQPKTLLHTGTFSKIASSGFTGAGWKLTPFGAR